MEIKSRFLASSVSSKEVADKLTAFLDKKGVDLAPKEFDETVEYIRSLFDDEWAALTAKSGIRNLDEAIRAWYNDTKLNYPESFIKQSVRKPGFGKAVKSSKYSNSPYSEEVEALREEVRGDIDRLIYKYQEKLGIKTGDTYLDSEDALENILAILDDQYNLR
jgi:hypothetical protein